MPADRRPILARALTVVAASVIALAGTPAPAGAQEPTPVSIELVGQPVWHGPDDRFNLRLRIVNDGTTELEGFRLQLRVFDPAGSRSELHDNFDVDPARIESDSLPIDRATLTVDPGEAASVVITERIEEVGFLAGQTTSGVYPLTVTVTDTEGLVALDTLTTQLIFLPSDVEVPLNLAFVWPISDIPSRGGEGVFEIDPATPEQTRLEAAVSERGWLAGLGRALAMPAAEQLRFALASSPRLIEELDDMADGYPREDGDNVRTVPPGDSVARAAAAVLDRFRQTVELGRVQAMLVPYSLPDLPSLTELEQLSSQLIAGEAVLEDVLRTTPGRAWVFPPGGRLDEPSLERLHASDAGASTFFAADSLEPPVEGVPGCRSDSPVGITYTCPVAVSTSARRARGFVLDTDLQDRFAAMKPFPADALLFQQLFAETAMIWAELPQADDRVVALAAPPMWHPPPRVVARFVRTLARAPWLNAITPRGGLHLGIGAVERGVITEATGTPTQPDETFIETIESSMDVVESFARVRPPLALIQRLNRDVLVAQSRLWWGDSQTLQRGLSFADDARREAEAELEKISIGGRQDITLTSSKGPVPLVLENKTGYDVSLEIHLESSDRDLEISERTISETFGPGATPLPIEASARSSGIYPVRVRVQTTDGYDIFETSISVRSTEFNEIALGITVGALAFLVLFYVFRSTRRRRASQADKDAD